MTTLADDLIQAAEEAASFLRGQKEGAVEHHFPNPREIRKSAKLTQEQMAPLMGMSLSGYRKWEQGVREVSGPALTLLRVLEREPEAVLRALRAG